MASTITLEHLHQDILGLRGEIELIKSIIEEDFELTPQAKKALEKARKTPKEEYISQEALRKSCLHDFSS